MWYTVYQYPQITILIVKWWSTRSSFQKWLICYLLSALIVFATGLKKSVVPSLEGSKIGYHSLQMIGKHFFLLRAGRGEADDVWNIWFGFKQLEKRKAPDRHFREYFMHPFACQTHTCLTSLSLRTLLNAVLDCQLLRRIWRLVGYGKWFATQRNQCILWHPILYCILWIPMVRCGILWYVFEVMQWKRKQTLKCTCNF